MENGEKRWCPECEQELELKLVDNTESWVCPSCSKITDGYYGEETELVKSLRGYLFKSEWWRIDTLVNIFRKYAGK